MNLSDSDGEILVRMIAAYRKAHEQRPSWRVEDIQSALIELNAAGVRDAQKLRDDPRLWVTAMLAYLDEEQGHQLPPTLAAIAPPRK